MINSFCLFLYSTREKLLFFCAVTIVAANNITIVDTESSGGGSGSGKATVTEEISKIFPNNFKLLHLCLDSFYIKNLSEIKQNKLHTNINFDHPNSFDWKLIRETINNLLNRKEVKIPIYDYVNSKRSEQFNTVKNIDVIIFEGILSLYDNYINDKAAIKIFVDTPDDERFIRRFLRDTKQRGRETENIIQQ